MRLLEFQFNPEKKDNFIFDSFCYVPENIYEKRMGGLFIFGELKNPLPHNYKLLEKTAQAIKKEFYSKFQRTQDQALKEAIKRGNEFLSAEVGRENTDWLGNMNFSIISLKNFDLNFTKIGNLKIFLIRGPHIIDIGSKLDSQEIEPYPLKVFNNIVSGKLAENDYLLVFSEGIFPAMKNLINKFAENRLLDEKEIKDILKNKENELSEISGMFVLVNLSKDVFFVKKPKIIFQKEKEKMSPVIFLAALKKISRKTASLFKRQPKTVKLQSQEEIQETKIAPTGPVKVKVKIEDKKTETKLQAAPKINFKLPSLKKPDIKLPKIKFSFRLPKIPSFEFAKIKNDEISKKKIILIVWLIIFLSIGFLIFQTQENKKQKEYLESISFIKEKVLRAEDFITIKNSSLEAKNQALSLLSAAWSEIVPMTKLDGRARKEALSVKEKIDEDLKNLNNMILLDNPDLLYKFDKEIFIPQKLVYDEKNLYFISQYVQNIFSLDQDKNASLIQKDQKFNETSEVSSGYVLLFSKPDQVTVLENDEPKTFSLDLLSDDFETSELASFKDSLYLLDASSGQIAKYSLPLSGDNAPQSWFWSKSAIKPVNGKSLAVDGYVWVLNKNNDFLKYYGGQLQATITPDVFPAPENFSKIVIPYGSQYIFASEPAQKRIIIFDKEGKIFKQYESEKFDSILDFAVSQDNKTIFVLNGLNVYEIEI